MTGKLIRDGESRAVKPDAQPFDEVRLVTAPRFKQSGMSGDEWRISIVAEFWRKGAKVHECGCGSKMDIAVAMLGHQYFRACDDGHGFYAGERDVCDQEGCSKQAVVCYLVKKEFSRDRPHEWNAPPPWRHYRAFCSQHKRRGDCGFDDADDNYEERPMTELPGTKESSNGE